MRPLISGAARSLAALASEALVDTERTSNLKQGSADLTGGQLKLCAISALIVCIAIVAAVGALCGKRSVAGQGTQQSPRAQRNVNTAKWGTGEPSTASKEGAKTNTTSTNVMLDPTTEGSESKDQNVTGSPQGHDRTVDTDSYPPPQPHMSLAEHMKHNASERVVQTRGDTVKDVVTLLHEVCDKMEGRMSAVHVVHKATIRPGIHAGIAEATCNGITNTVLFFPDGRRFNRQLRSYERRWLIDFLPNKAMHSNGGPYTHNDTTVMLPPFIMVDRVSTVPNAIAAAPTKGMACGQIFTICIQLYHQIYAFHRRDKILRDITVRNVVSTLTGSQRRWTLLEYCAVAGNGAESNSVPVRSTPPELAMKQMEAAPLHMKPSFDIWQLGVMVYEAMVGPYWPDGATDASILHKLATDSARLPHEEHPPDFGNVASMLKVLLNRDPADRPTAEQLKKVLEDHDNTGTVGSFTSPWVDAPHDVDIGSGAT